MAQIIINKKGIRKNRQIRKNQKDSKKAYTLKRSSFYKGKIKKFFNVNSEFIDLSSKKTFTTPSISNPEEFLALLKEHKMVGLGGEANDLAIKFDKILSYKGKKIFIINGVECDPGLIHDHYILHNRLDNVLFAAKVIKKLFGFDEVVLASKEDIVTDNTVRSAKLPYVYPMGYENFIIRELYGIEIKEYPTEKGILVLNLQTTLKIGELLKGIEFNSKYVTVANFNTGIAKVALVNFNEKIAKVLDATLGTIEGTLYVGGGSMFAEVGSLADSVDTKTCLIALGNSFTFNEGKCVGCGGCSRNCPSKIDLKTIVRRTEKNIAISKDEFNTKACISCGACSYGCAASKDIRGLIAKINGIN